MKGKLFLICGDDEYLVDTTARKRVNKLVPEGEREMGIEIIEGRCDNGSEVAEAVNRCIESVVTPGFFGAGKATWLRFAEFLSMRGRIFGGVASKEAIGQLTELVKGGLLEGQNLVVSTTKISRASSFFKLCAKVGKVDDFGSSMKGWQLEKRAKAQLEELLAEEGLLMESAAKTEFLARVGFDTRMMVQEVAKLAAYMGTVKRATVDDVRQVCSVGREAEAWDVIEAFGKRNPVMLSKTLHSLSDQRGAGIMVAAMLERSIRELLVLREAYDRKWVYGGDGRSAGWSANLPPEAEALLAALPINKSSLSGYVMRMRLPHALNYTIQELRVARYRVLDLREKLVTTGLPEMLLVETTLLRIIGRARGSRQRGAGGGIVGAR